MKRFTTTSVEGILRASLPHPDSGLLFCFVFKCRSKSGLYHCSVKVELVKFQRKARLELQHDSECSTVNQV